MSASPSRLASVGPARPTRARLVLAVALGAFALGLAAPPSARAQRDERRPSAVEVERARALFQRGAAHYEAGRLHEALEAFLASWRTVRNPMLAYNVARTYERLGDPDNGIRFYGYYLRNAAPDAADRAEVEERIRALEGMRQRQRDQLRTLPPSSDQLAAEARRFFERGLTMYRRRQYRAALAAFTAAYNFTRPDPPPEVVYNLGMTSERLEQPRDAIDYYREYARMLPRDSAERRAMNERVTELRAAAR